MKKSKFTESQIVFALKQAETGVPVQEVCRKMGISEPTFYNWKKKFSGLGTAELRRLRQLEEENARLKQVVADLTLDKQMLQDVLKKKALRARERRQLVKKLIDEYRISIKRASALCLLARSLVYYQAHGSDDRAVRQRIKEIAATRVRYGVARIHVLLRREGWRDNHKRVRRIYREEGLNLRAKRPRRNKAAAHRMEAAQMTAPNQCWSMDFVSDALFDGRRFRALTLVDNFSRECLEIEIGQSLKGEDVVRVMNRMKLLRGSLPERVKVDNGSEFISKALDKWAYENNVTLEFSRPGKPTDNAFIESFNGSFRDECLNTNWFLSIEDAREKIAAFKEDYNNYRPHSALGNLTPMEAIEKHEQTRNSLF
ncbi:MAG: IS3 family transposase [Acidobacteriota bacterium]|nr:IS3 family transposase [Acidobacteriota bacterium]